MKTFKPQATILLNNFGGIELMLNESNDGIYFRFNYGQAEEEIHEAEIEYTSDYESLAFFEHEGTRYYLSDAMLTKF